VSTTVPSRLLSGPDAIYFLRSEWDAMERLNPLATVFQTSGWYSAWIESVAHHERAEPLVLCLYDFGKPRAGIALQVSDTDGGSIQVLSWPWADYHEAVGSPLDGDAIELLARAVMGMIEELRLPIIFEDVMAGGLLERVMRLLSARESAASPTEAIDLTDAAHLRSILDHHEYVVKSRRLGRLGPVRCHHYREIDQILRRLPVFIEMHRRQWADRANAVAPFGDGVVESAFENMVKRLAPRGQLLLTEYPLGEQAIAMYFGFTHGCRYGGYRTAFAHSHRRFSPGHLMLRQMIVDFAAAGFHELDLMRGSYMYKQHYSNRSRQNRRFEIR
jgi:CelD/BcsL family acetyltransferase involved in cellulose biosynthesis